MRMTDEAVRFPNGSTARYLARFVLEGALLFNDSKAIYESCRLVYSGHGVFTTCTVFCSRLVHVLACVDGSGIFIVKIVSAAPCARPRDFLRNDSLVPLPR